MDQAEIEKRFRKYDLDDQALIQSGFVRDGALAFANDLNEACPESREKSLALTALEESLMWANAAIARNQSTQES